MDSKGTAFVILMNHASTPIRKKRLSPTSKARREASRNEFVEKGRIPNKVESYQESIVDRIVQEPSLGLLNPFEMD